MRRWTQRDLFRRLGAWPCDFAMWWAERGARVVSLIGLATRAYGDQWMVLLSWVMIMRPIVPPTSQPGTNEIHVPACAVPG